MAFELDKLNNAVGRDAFLFGKIKLKEEEILACGPLFGAGGNILDLLKLSRPFGHSFEGFLKFLTSILLFPYIIRATNSTPIKTTNPHPSLKIVFKLSTQHPPL